MASSASLLIVDQDEESRKGLRAQLEHVGFRVLEASSGSTGLDLCYGERPALIIVVLGDYDTNAYEFCSQVHKSEKLGDIPVIFCGPFMLPEDRVRVFEAGAVDFIVKPFCIEELRARISVHIHHREHHHSLKVQNDELQQSTAILKLLNKKLIDLNESLKTSEQVKSRFLALVRNELNDPLSTLLVSGRQILEIPSVSELVKSLARIMTAATLDLDFRINNILWASELEAGESSPNMVRVDVISILKDVLDSFELEAKAKSVSLICDVPAGQTLFFWTDAQKLRTIVANLISNAIKFNKKEGVVCVGARGERDGCYIDVQDTGIGVAPEYQQTIFQSFHQIQEGLTRGYRGLGLGLSVAIALAEVLGGRIRLESKLGEGSRFSCHLPMGSKIPQTMTEALDGNVFFLDSTEGDSE